MAQEKRFQTPRGRLSFPFIFEPRKPEKPGDKEKYSLSLIFDKAAQETSEWKALVAEVRAMAVAKFGVDVKQTDGTTKRVVPKGIRNPIRDGGEKVKADQTPMDGYGPGTVFISATSERPPGVVDGNKQVLTKKDGPAQVYAGCYVRASLTVYSYDRKDGKGVTFGLRNVQKMADGEAFGGGGDPTKDFDVVPNYQSAPAAGTDFAAAGGATTDDDIPF